MHLETLLYMLLQSDRTYSPGIAPDFALLSEQAKKRRVPNQWFQVPATSIAVGLDDPENDDGPSRFFGWDNEKPRRSIHIPAFEAQARPLTNEDYARFLDETGQLHLPASWTVVQKSPGTDKAEASTNGHCNGASLNGHGPGLSDEFLKDKYVKTVYGPIPLIHALDWPVFASYDELSKCATWMNGRIPTADEARSIYNYVDYNKNKHPDSIITKKISAVNG